MLTTYSVFSILDLQFYLMKKLLVFVFAVVLLGSCGQGSQNENNSEVVETQLP
tara:strand:- start:505 stop:663 length:159 start_codon:yes stop_codon:yes gene_type:complete